MRLPKYESLKLFSREFVTLGIIFCFIADLFLLFAFTDRRLAETNRELVRDLGDGSPQEQLDILMERYETVSNLYEIEKYLGQGKMVPQTENILRNLLDQYGELYENNSYKLYTETYQTELNYLSMIRSELSTVAGYRDFLENTQTQVEEYSAISIFSNTDTFSYRNMVRAAEDYRKLTESELEIEYYPQQGIYTALNFSYTDLFVLLSTVLISGLLITGEYDTGIYDYILTYPNGRARTALAKYMAMSLSLLFAVAALYGINLGYCAGVYGLGSLTRHVQAMPFLMRFTYPVRIWEYILIFILAKWLVSCILGGAVMLIMQRTGKFLPGTLLSLAFYGINYLIYQASTPNTKLAPFRHINPYGMMRINEWLGTYLNYDVGGEPFSSKALIAIAFLFFSVLLPVLFACSYPHKPVTERSVLSEARGRCFAPGPTTVQREENYKNFILGGTAAILAAALALSVYTGIKKDNLITAKEIYYSLYIRPMSGPYDEECRNKMQEISGSKEFQEIADMEELNSRGLVSSDEYRAFYYSHYDGYKRKEAFDELLNKVTYVKEHPGAQIMYETGYKKLFDLRETTDRTDMVKHFLLILICCCNIFCQERTSGMDKMLGALANGRKRLQRAKHRNIETISLAAAGLSLLERMISVVKDYGLPAFFAPAMSMKEYSELPAWLSVFLLYVISACCRYLACYICALVTSYISARQKSAISVLFFSSLIMLGPVLLYILGIRGLKNVGLYPLMHFGALLADSGDRLFAVCYLATAAVLAAVMRNELLKRYED